MRNTKFFLIGISVALSIGFAAPSLAAGLGGSFSAAPPGSVGPYISGVWLGNTSNLRPSGNGVLPSWAPGPAACGIPGDCAGPTQPGASPGEVFGALASGGQASPDFNAQPHDFSAPHL